MEAAPYRAPAYAPLSLAMVRSPKAARTLAWVFATFFVAAVAGLFLLPWQQPPPAAAASSPTRPSSASR